MGGRGSSGIRGNYVEAKLANMNKDGEYRYHSTTLDNLENINRKGLLPSKTGQFGKGVYFSYNIEDSRQWEKNKQRQILPWLP